jgi:beta-lactamase class A
MTGLLFQPDLDTEDLPASLDEVAAAVPKLAPQAQLLVASLEDHRCHPVRAVHADRVQAIGSTFKLYVLLAVASQIEAGKTSWDAPIAVRDAWKSLPSGVTQNQPAGTELTVRELATKMISISDNTAADHLLHTVGRKAVEAAMKRTGIAEPGRNVPFLTTRELFELKLAVPHDAVDAYLAMPVAARRAYLTGDIASRELPEITGEWKKPRHIDTLEWFASASDLCKAMAALDAAATRPALAPIRAILSQNPGLPFDRAPWTFIGFKGGSEPGVLTLSWLLERTDGQRFVVVLGLNDREAAIADEAGAMRLARATVGLLATWKP